MFALFHLLAQDSFPVIQTIWGLFESHPLCKIPIDEYILWRNIYYNNIYVYIQILGNFLVFSEISKI
jgi:hypothetical protein